ncbi:hypothetical protein PENSUB_5668 [Penicillium subrubescens]|uniref:DUF427 domain-containing protein n=1 Tax=Penicillium subrubescens TaxID=1316194 RepID=A0A1Q5U748_9EURO|nr:hypothetical protein PENSUB_5668 [Penicillium subrubescens]
MPTAKASVGDLVLAEADAWETVEGNVYDAAWYYANPYEKATNIKDHIAFCKSNHSLILEDCADYYSPDKSKVLVTVE